MSVTFYATNHFWHHYPKRPSELGSGLGTKPNPDPDPNVEE